MKPKKLFDIYYLHLMLEIGLSDATDALRKFEDSVKEFGNTPWEHSAYFESFAVK